MIRFFFFVKMFLELEDLLLVNYNYNIFEIQFDFGEFKSSNYVHETDYMYIIADKSFIYFDCDNSRLINKIAQLSSMRMRRFIQANNLRYIIHVYAHIGVHIYTR